MALKAYTVPGLDKPLWLPDDIRVEIKIINNGRFRSFQKSFVQNLTTWHDTGPTGGNADSEWNWANDGRQGAGAGGYNAIIDDDQIIICLPFDEVTWHAGSTFGNKTSYGAEQCRQGVDRAKAIRNAAAYHGALCAAKGWEVDTHLVQHNYWLRSDGTHKDCPSYIRQNGLWSNAVKQTSEFAAAAREAMGGDGTGGAPVPPTYAKPSPIAVLDAVSKSDGLAPPIVHDPSSKVDFIWTGDRYRAIRDTPRRRYASLKSELIGPDITKGEAFDGDFVFFTEDAWWLITPYGTRILLADLERISDTKGEAVSTAKAA